MIYKPSYSRSHALVIGINDYVAASPLAFAVADAKAVSQILQARFEFPTANVTLLLDEHATKAAILKAFFAYSLGSTGPDDRLIVFFAGHGQTVEGRRGDVGYLVPHDDDPDDLGSMIRWRELTEGADMFDAKHVLFLMDACYGGLAITRARPAGSMRFMRDMLRRGSRQVLTAGKANETVGDEGGPLPGHSPFTGHLLEALGGKAAYGDGIITANGVMSYVYSAVGRDPRSRQTPHYGYLDGDGDLIFAAPELSAAAQAAGAAATTGEDVLIAVPSVGSSSNATDIGRPVRYAGVMDQEEFVRRVNSYESITDSLCRAQALIGHWAGDATRSLLTLGPRRLADRLESASGNVGLIAARWYPVLLLVYAGGIAAVHAKRYDNLRELFHGRAPTRRGEPGTLVAAVIEGISEAGDAFKLLPGQDRKHTPMSEHLHELLQPPLDDLLFLGSDYEAAFDQFEMLLAFEFAHQTDRGWGPLGRFGWKSLRTQGPLGELRAEAEKSGDNWAPLRAGLVGGSQKRFAEIFQQIAENTKRLGWS